MAPKNFALGRKREESRETREDRGKHDQDERVEGRKRFGPRVRGWHRQSGSTPWKEEGREQRREKIQASTMKMRCARDGYSSVLEWLEWGDGAEA
jgi:hypothetical protein